MKLVVATNDEKRSAHLQRIVTQIGNDKRRGEAYLPQLMVDKLRGLHRVFRKQITALGKANGRKISAVQARNETTRELCYLVRDVYVMAKRKYERGKIDDHVLATHVIPKEPVRDNERMTASWVSRAELILDGDLAYTASNPTILRDPTRVELQAAMSLADRAHQEAIDAVDHLGQMQTRMQELRKELDQLLLKARHALVGSFFYLTGPALREVLHAYGYHYKGKRRRKVQPETLQYLPAESPTPGPKEEQVSVASPIDKQTTPKREKTSARTDFLTPKAGKISAPPDSPTPKTEEIPAPLDSPTPKEEQATAPPAPKVSIENLPADFTKAITLEEIQPSPPPKKQPQKKQPKTKGSTRKQPSAKEKEKKKSRRKQARQSRKQNR